MPLMLILRSVAQLVFYGMRDCFSCPFCLSWVKDVGVVAGLLKVKYVGVEGWLLLSFRRLYGLTGWCVEDEERRRRRRWKSVIIFVACVEEEERVEGNGLTLVPIQELNTTRKGWK